MTSTVRIPEGKKLMVLDMDGVLVPGFTWLTFNQMLGLTVEEDEQLFEEWQSGHMSYQEWANKILDIYYLFRTTGDLLDRAVIEKYAQEIVLETGAKELVDWLRAHGFYVLLLSGGVSTIVATIAERTGCDAWIASTTLVYNSLGQLMSMHNKGDEACEKLAVVHEICNQNHIDIRKVYAIGDGGNEHLLFQKVKGIMFGRNKTLAPFAWKQADTLSQCIEILKEEC